MTSYSMSVHVNPETEIESGFLPKTGSQTLTIGDLTVFISGSPAKRLFVAEVLRDACDNLMRSARHDVEQQRPAENTMPCGCNSPPPRISKCCCVTRSTSLMRKCRRRTSR